MVLKVLLILLILGAAIGAGSVYMLYDSPEFSASLRITEATPWGSGIKASADLILVSKLPNDVIRITELSVLIAHPTEANLHFLSKNIAPPVIELLPGETKVVEVKNILLQDLNFIGSEVKIVVDVKYTVSPRDQPYGGVPVAFHVERVIDLASFIKEA